MPRLKWIKKSPIDWHLEFCKKNGIRIRIIAHIWERDNMFIWHTFDHGGSGGENDVVFSLKQAKLESTLSAIEQGFI